MCIEGVVEGDIVTGVGYEIFQYGTTKPDIEQDKIKFSQNIWSVSKEGYWDNSSRGGQGGNNLIANSTSFYKLIEPEQPGNNYWAWIRYNLAQLDLSEFKREESTSSYQLKKNEQCVS